MSKRIALDFDDTYTAMPEVWDTFIVACKEAGHSVTIVTARFGSPHHEARNEDITEVCERLGIEVVYCNYEQKASCFQADIVIDDCPCSWPSIDLMKCMSMSSEVG